MNDSRIEWRIDAANSLAVRSVLYGWIGLFGGGTVLVLAVFAVSALASALAGEFAVLALFVVLVLVGGPCSVLYLWPALRYGSRPPLSMFVVEIGNEPEETLAERYGDAFSWKGVVVAVLCNVLLIPLLLVVDGRVLMAYVGLWFVLLVVGSGFTSWGRIDVDEPRFEYGTATVPVEGIERVRRMSLGGVVVCWVSYRAGIRTISTPSWIVLTPEAMWAFDRAVERTSVTGRGARPSNPAITVAAVGIGLTFFTFGVGIWFIEGIDPGIAAYVSVITGLLGALFCWAGISLT